MHSRHLIDLSDLSVSELEEITRLACDIKQNTDTYYGACRGKILATLFASRPHAPDVFSTAMLVDGVL